MPNYLQYLVRDIGYLHVMLMPAQLSLIERSHSWSATQLRNTQKKAFSSSRETKKTGFGEILPTPAAFDVQEPHRKEQ